METKQSRYEKLLPNDYYFIKKVKELGIKPNYIGYYYIIEILEMLINQGMIVRSFSKQVYPILAIKYNKNANTIERDIRSVIKKFWNSSLKDKLMCFWLKENIPTCCEFIYIIKNYVMQDFI